MKAVIQRVINASVAGQLFPFFWGSVCWRKVDGQTISSIGKGLLVLIGIDKREYLLHSMMTLTMYWLKDDEPSDSTTIIKKILSAKLFDDETGAWKRDVRDIGGEVLCGQSVSDRLVFACLVYAGRGLIWVVSQFTLLATLQGTKPGMSSSCRWGDGWSQISMNLWYANPDRFWLLLVFCSSTNTNANHVVDNTE
jgi:D-Tyr-tRNAtyr deacylase